MVPKPKAPLHFEETLSELAQIVEKMEKGDLALDESLKSFEKGIQLIAQCQETLRKAEQKIQILTQKDRTTKLENYQNESLDDS